MSVPSLTDRKASMAGSSVYIAPVVHSIAGVYERVRRDLEERGVVVHGPGGHTEEEMRHSVLPELERAAISVHLMDQSGRVHNEGAPLIALDTALHYSKTHPNFHVLVWTDEHVPAVAHDGGEQHDVLFELIRQDRDFTPQTEFVRSTIEDFKSLIYDRLRAANSIATAIPPATISATSGAELKLYVIYDQQDKETAKPVTEYLEKSGVTVLEPIFEGEQTRLRTSHNESLRRCDAALIIYGKVREPWVRMKQQDLLRAAALGRQKRLTAKGVVLCPTQTDMKLRFTAPDLVVMNAFESSTERLRDALTPFLQSISLA